MSGIHGEPYGAPSDFCHECARLNAWPISCTAVQKRFLAMYAGGFGSPIGGGSEMNEL